MEQYMVEQYVVVLTIVGVFFVAPLAGVVLVVRDIIKSRGRGKKLDILADELDQRLKALKTEGVSGFYGSFSRYLETVLPQLDPGWLRAGCRLLMPLTEVGLGEMHRASLASDQAFRYQALRGAREISTAIRAGRPYLMYDRIGSLFSLFYCSEAPTEAEKFDCRHALSKALRQCSQLSPSQIYQSDRLVSDLLVQSSRSCQSEISGWALLVLHWMSIMLKKRPAPINQSIVRQLDGVDWLRERFSSMADMIEAGDIVGVTGIISSSFEKDS